MARRAQRRKLKREAQRQPSRRARRRRRRAGGVGHAAEHAERMPMGIEQHLMVLQWIDAKKKSPAVRELRMGHLKLDPFATE
mgnify:CR=1 FL=1